MSKRFRDVYHARRKLEPNNDEAVPVHRVAYRVWFRHDPWVRAMLRYKGAFNALSIAPELYGYKRVNSYKCEIDQDEARMAVMVVTLKKAGFEDRQIAKGMSAQYGGEVPWWFDRIPYILNAYKYYCGRHLVYNADGEIVYPPFMEP